MDLESRNLHFLRFCEYRAGTRGADNFIEEVQVELGHRGVLQPRWVQKMHRGGVDFDVEGGCAVEFIMMSPTSDPPREV